MVGSTVCCGGLARFWESTAICLRTAKEQFRTSWKENGEDFRLIFLQFALVMVDASAGYRSLQVRMYHRPYYMRDRCF